MSQGQQHAIEDDQWWWGMVTARLPPLRWSSSIACC